MDRHSPEDRRAHARWHVAGEVQYSGSEGVSALGIHDVSSGGIRLVLTGPETVGRDVDLSIALSEGEPVLATGRVVWARQVAPYAAGIRFFAPQSGLHAD